MVKTVLTVVGLVLAGGIFFFYTQPAYDNTQAIQAQIGEYDQALTKAAELQQLKQTLLSRYNAFDPQNLDRLQKLLPDHVDNVRLILDMDNLARQHGMALQNVVISDQSAKSDNGVIGAIATSQQKYDSLTLKFGTHGTYTDFMSFLNDLESSLRIVDLISLGLTQDSSAPGAEPVYSFNITMRTYWLK